MIGRLVSFTIDQRSVARYLCGTLASLGVGVLVAGCGVFGPSIALHPPGAAPSPNGSAPGPSKFLFSGAASGELVAAPGKLLCSSRGRSFSISGLLGADHATLTVTGLRPRQTLLFPPTTGTFADSVTLAVSGPSLPKQSFVAGPSGGVFQGTGSLSVSKTGQTGSLQLDMSSNLNAGTQTLGISLSGTWDCRR